MTDVDREFAQFRTRGDATALGRVYDATAGELFALATRLLGDPIEAEDAVQATFVAAIESAATFDPNRRVMPWLVGILNHRVRQHRQRLQRARAAATTAAPIGDDRTAELREIDAQVTEALAALPEPYRAVLVLRLRHALEPAEIAYALERSPATVRSQLARGLERLRARLPSSYAAPAWLALPLTVPRGLEALRDVVVAHAHQQASALATGALGGAWTATWGLVMTHTKALAASLVLLTLSALWLGSRWRTAGSDDVDAPRAVGATGPRDGASATAPTRSAASTAAGPASKQAPAELPRQTASAPTSKLVVRVEHAGRPLGAVPVHVAYHDERGTPSGVPTGDFAATDRAGEVEFHVALSARATAEIRVAGAGSITRSELLPDSTTEVTVAVKQPGWVRGIVRDHHGAPVSAATVWTSPQLGGEFTENLLMTTSDGRFEVPLWTRSRVGARAPGLRSGHRLLAVEPGQVLDADLTLRGGGAELVGTVVRNGQPVAAEVRIGAQFLYHDGELRADGNTESTWPVRVVTDASGGFACAGLTPGPVRVHAVAGDGPIAQRDTVLVAGERVAVQIELRAARVQGRITTADGTPARGASVAYRGSHGLGHRRAIADADGRYTLTGLPAEAVELVASDGARRAKTVLELSSDAPTEWSPVLLDKPSWIAGRVTDDAGAPLAGWWVVAHQHAEPQDVGAPQRLDAAGAFALGPFVSPDGWLRLCVHPPSDHDKTSTYPSEPPLLQSEPVPIGARDLALVVPRDGLPSATLRGRVQPARTVRLALRDALGHSTFARNLSADGTFTFAPLRPGRWELRNTATYPATLLGSWELARGEVRDVGAIAVPEHATGRLRCVVVMPAGTDHLMHSGALATLVVYQGDDDVALQHRTVHSAAVDVDLPPGAYRVRLIGAPVEPLVRTVELRAGATTELELTPRPATFWRCRFDPLLRAGPDDQRVRLEVRDAAEPQAAPVWVQESARGFDGWFFEANLRPGRYTWSARTVPGGQFAAIGELRLEDHGARPALFTLREVAPRGR